MTATSEKQKQDRPPAPASIIEPSTSRSQDGGEMKNANPGGLMRVFTYGRPIDLLLEGVALLASIGAGVALALVNLVMGRSIAVFTDYSTGSSTKEQFMDDVGRFSLYFVCIGIARLALTYIYSTLFTYVAFNMIRNVRHSYLRAALSQEVGYFDLGVSGSISVQATSNGKLIHSGIAEKLGVFLQAIATFVAGFVIAFVADWKLTLIISCIVPSLLIILGGTSIFQSKVETRILPIYAQAGAYVESVLGSIRTLHAFSLRPRVMHKYSTYLDNARKLGDRNNPLYGVMFASQYCIFYGGMALAFWQGIGMISRDEVDNVGTVFTVLFSVIVASTSLNVIAPHIVTFNRAATAASELFTLIDRSSQIDPFEESGCKPDEISGAIELQGIHFSYPTRPSVHVLQDFSLHIPPGKVTALVGASGCGKSTIIGLLERWYNPMEGSIKLDGQNIQDLNLRWLRTAIRLVQQEPVLFSGTIFENIANGLVGTPWESASYEEQLKRVRHAAQLAFADEFVTNLPGGYDTYIVERGGLLSGGQKQRIAIARSIISEPKILLLDEATSALDPHAEGIVQRALDSASRDRTTIVIAHKLATIRDADNIVVMSKGKIVEQGRHDELVAMNGSYAKLVKAQDLSSVEKKDKIDDTSNDDASEVASEAAKITQTLERCESAETSQLASLKNREDFGLHKQTALPHTILKLIRATPDIAVWYFLALLACVVGAGVYPGQTLLLGSLMDVFSAPDMVARGNFISLMYFIMALGCFVVYFTLGWTTNVIAQTLYQKVRKDMIGAVLKQDLRFFDREENSIGALTSRLDSHSQAVLELMGFNIALAVIAFVNVVSSSVIAIVISWRLGLVGVFAGMPPILLSGYARIRIEAKMDADVDRNFSRSASIASEATNAIRTVSSLAIERRFLQMYTNELDSAISSSVKPLSHMMLWFSLTQSIEYFILGLGFWWGARLVSNREITFYQFIISFMGLYFSGTAAAQIFSFSSSFTKGNSAGNYYFWLLGLKPMIQETEENANNGPTYDYKSIAFHDVKFSYPLAPENRVLNGVSLTINRGEFVALVGSSGCGKSTMISLLERFYDPTSGKIVINYDNALTDMNPRLHRRSLALVQQEPKLLPGTIRENISMGIEITTEDGAVPGDDLIEAACRAANVWDFVSSLPEGLSTLCGNSGDQLSGGQKQRIAIARALIRNPAVILLDEATSALDTESEKVVQKALMESAAAGDRIMIAVAHRLSTIRDADRICVFYGGRIVESGTHDDLIEIGGIYKKMCEAQSLDRSV